MSVLHHWRRFGCSAPFSDFFKKYFYWKPHFQDHLCFENGGTGGDKTPQESWSIYHVTHDQKWRFWEFPTIGNRVCLTTVLDKNRCSSSLRNRCLNKTKTFHHVLQDKLLQDFRDTFPAKGLFIYLFIYRFVQCTGERTIGHVVPYLVHPPNPTP